MIRLCTALVLCALLLCGCGEAGGPVQAGGVAPDFRAQDVLGRTHYLNDELDRPLVLTFFATWCAPCRREIPLMIELEKRHAGRVNVLCVVVDAQAIDSVRSLVAELKIPYPMLLDESGRIKRIYGVQSLPTTLVIRPDRKIAARFVGFDDQDAAALDELLLRLVAVK
ncbi:MAG: TlpA disulfide reductase family protein [Candidatus Alcyoniella australis]|nr:TlpA disulfide reductase family protein [Candidatus Alcyoniella australis]